jgi:Mce-associated membrane protein
MTEAESMTETETNAVGDTSVNGNIVEYEVDDDEDTLGADERTPSAPTSAGSPSVRLALVSGLVIVVALAALAGWLGLRAHESRSTADQHDVAVQVAEQGAINLTTIDWQQADSNIRRILDGATRAFYDDFSQRSQPFVEVVKRAKSTSVGTVTAAALESESGDDARVLVTVSVKTTAATTPEAGPRLWRMRMSLHQVHDQLKVSDVEFVA